MRKKAFAQERMARKQNKILPRILVLAGILLVLAGAVFAVSVVVNRTLHNSNTITSLYTHWEDGDYQGVYDISTAILNDRPLQNAARTFHGYSSFQLALAETDSAHAQSLLDEAVQNLRIAMQTARADTIPQIAYMLGKTYFYKDTAANYHYYADLAIKYLLQAQEAGYEAKDSAEYLGLSYAALGETQKSIESFGLALLVRESDTLFLSLAEQYFKLENYPATRSYLTLVDQVSKNDDLLARSHLLQGQMYLQEEKYPEAKAEFEAILEKNENSADAHYGLCVLYDKQGDIAKFRAELRTCLRIQPDHAGALALSER